MKNWGKWKALGVYFAYSMLIGAAWCVFSTIPQDAADYYDINEQLVALFELSFMWTYVFVAVPSSYLMHYSLRLSITASCFVLAIGGGVRYLAGHSFIWALVGQSIIALGNVVALAGCAPLAELWFPPHQVLLATAMGSLSNGLGVGCQMILSPTLGNIPITLGLFAILGCILALASLLLLESDPLHPSTSVRQGDVKAYLKNKDAMQFLLFAASAVGTWSAYLGLIYGVLEPSGYSGIQIGLIGTGLAVSGLLGGFCVSLSCRSCPEQLTLLRICLCIGLLGSIAMCVAVLTFAAMLPVSCIYGFGICGFVPLAIREVVERNPELDPAVPANILFFTAQIFSLIYSYPSIYFQVLTGLSGLYIIAGFTVCSVVPFLILMKKTEEPEGNALLKQENDAENKVEAEKLIKT